MPELPEVETIKRELKEKIKGLRIEEIEVRKKKMFIGDKKEVIGREILKVKRRAKILVFVLSGNYFLIIHLKMSGQLIYGDKNGGKIMMGQRIPFAGRELPGRTTRIIFYFSNGGRLFFNDLRQFGWVKVRKTKERDLSRVIGKKLGKEPMGSEFKVSYLKKVFGKTRRAVKVVLMDQEKIAGIGNIYANEALFVAGVRPDRKANSLSEEEIKRVHKGVIKVLKKGIKAKGASGGDEAYINTKGEKGNYDFLVYQREGEKCVRCKEKIERMKIGGRGTFFCPGCQS